MFTRKSRNSRTLRSRPRVANITEDGRYAGPQRRIVLVADSLARRHEIETTVIHPRRNADRLVRELHQHNIKEHTLALHRLSRNWLDFFKMVTFFPWEVAQLFLYLRRGEFDLVHCNSSWQWKGAIAARLAGIPVIWHLNDTSTPSSVKCVFHILATYCASAFITAGERVNFYYIGTTGLAKRPKCTIQAPVVCCDFTDIHQERTSRSSETDPLRIITLANVNPTKDIETLVRTSAALQKMSPGLQTEFFVYGGMFNSQKKYLYQIKTLIDNLEITNVHLHVPIENIRAVLFSSDIYLCTSRAEASPMAIWEAAEAGLPIVTTDVGDVGKFNSEWNFCKIAPVGDEFALATALLTLATDPAKRQQFGNNGRRFVTSKLDVSICASLHASAYRLLLTQS